MSAETATGTVTHVAGLDVSFGDYLRQRCAWCGALLVDQDLTRVARPVESADLPFPRWPVGALVEVTSGYPKVSTVVEGEPSETGDGIRVPDSCCMRLPPEVTQ